MQVTSVRKLFIDSRFKSAGSASSSDFEFELNHAITLPNRPIAGYVTDIHLMHSWYNVDTHAQYLYYAENWGANVADTRVKHDTQ